jgi:cell division protein FtsB
VLAGANIITLAIFAEYTIKIRKAQIKLEKKNGAEQKQLNQLKAETKLLEAEVKKLKENQK